MFPSFCEIGTGSSPGVGEPPHSVLVNSTVLPSVSPPHSVRVLLQLARLPRTRSNHVQITKIISKANEDQREKDWAKGLSQGLGQGSHLRPQLHFFARGGGANARLPGARLLRGAASSHKKMKLGPEVGPLTQPLAQPLGPTLFSLIFVGF